MTLTFDVEKRLFHFDTLSCAFLPVNYLTQVVLVLVLFLFFIFIVVLLCI